MNRTISPFSSMTVGESVGETTTTDTCAQHTRAKSQGRPPRKPGSQPTGRDGLPNHDLSLDSPCPGARDATPRRGRQADDRRRAQFHAGRKAILGRVTE